MALKSVLTGASRALLTPRQLSGSFVLRTRMNHNTSGFEPLFPAVRSNGSILPSIGFGLLKEAVVAAFRGLTVVSVGLLVSDLIHGTEATHLKNKVYKDFEKVWKSIGVTKKGLEEARRNIESLKISRLMKNFTQQSKLMQEFNISKRRLCRISKRSKRRLCRISKRSKRIKLYGWASSLWRSFTHTKNRFLIH